MMMNSFIQHLIDFIFPPSEVELSLRSLSPTEFLKRAKISSLNSSLFSYKDPLVKELVWQIKYKKNRHAIGCAGYALYNELIKRDSSSNFILIPIPISKKRRKERGYNQCELIIAEILKLDTTGKLSGDYVLLRRAKHIERQTMKNRSDRIENTKNIFEVTENKLNKESNIVIIDDVTTTGSTINEARKALFQAGYKNVSSLTIAH